MLRRDLCVHFVSSKDNFADIFTKLLLAPLLLLLRSKLMAEYSPIRLRGGGGCIKPDDANNVISLKANASDVKCTVSLKEL